MNDGRLNWKNGLPGFSRDPLKLAVDELKYQPDPKLAGADVNDSLVAARIMAESEDLPQDVREMLVKNADFLAYYQVLLMRASRTVFRGVLVLGLLIILILMMLFAGKA